MHRLTAISSAALLASTLAWGCASREPEAPAPNREPAAQHTDDHPASQPASQVAGVVESGVPADSEPVEFVGSMAQGAKQLGGLTAERLKQAIEESRTDPAIEEDAEADAPQSADEEAEESAEPPNSAGAAQPD